jgi:hypothetical protein
MYDLYFKILFGIWWKYIDLIYHLMKLDDIL